MKIKHSFRLLSLAAVLFSLLFDACASSTPVADTTTPTTSPTTGTITASLIARKPSLTPRPTRTLKPSLTIAPTGIPTLTEVVAFASTYTPEANFEPGDTPDINSEPVDISEPTSEDISADTNPENTNTKTPTLIPSKPGLRRDNPYPVGQAASVPNWTVQVVGMKRGREAQSDLEEANSTTMPPPTNFEYLLVKIKVKCAYADKEQHSISASDFKVTGDRLIGYNPLDVTVPDPALDYVLQAGEQEEGWASYLVGKNEYDLILAVDEISNDSPDRLRYIALDGGASIGIPTGLADIQATDLGTTPSMPAPLTVKVITNEWEVSVVDVIKGKTANDMVMASPYNLPPDEGMQFIVVKVYVRYRNTEDRPAGVDNYYFTDMDSSGTMYDFTSLISPSPSLDVVLFPGGDYAGYVVVQAPVNASGLNLVFQAIDDSTGESLRYLSLGF
jgi:hypothetical protein